MKLNQSLVVVFLVLLIPTAWKMYSSGISYVKIDEKSRLFEGYSKDNIAFIQLSKPKKGEDGKVERGQDGKPARDTLVMQRQEDEWVIQSGPYPGLLKARGSDIDYRILDKVGKIQNNESTIIVQQAGDVELQGFELDEESAMRLDLFDANRQPIAELFIGRAAGGAELGEHAVTGTYVRRPKQKVVIQTDQDLTLDVKMDDWVNKTVQDIDASEITGVRLSNEKGEVVFKREEKKDWELEKTSLQEHGPVRKDEIETLMNRLRSLTVQDFVEFDSSKPMPDHGLDTPRIEASVTTKDGKVHKLRIGKKVEGKQEYYALLEGLDVPLSLADWDVTYYEKDPKDFFDPKPAEKKPEDEKGAEGKEGGDEHTEKKDAEKKDAEKKDAEKKDAGKKDAEKKDAEKKDAGKKDAGKKDAGKKDAGKKDAEKKAEGTKSGESKGEGEGAKKGEGDKDEAEGTRRGGAGKE